MTNALTPQQKFEEKVKDRIRDGIGDMIPDEMLTQMVNAVLHESLMKAREVKQPGMHSRTEIKPSLVEELVTEMLKSKIEGIIIQHLADNQKRIEKAITANINDNIGAFLAQVVVETMQGQATNLGQQLTWKMQGNF